MKYLRKNKIDSCIHFAGLKAVGESVAKPWEYYENNIAGTLTLVDVMRKHGCKKYYILFFRNSIWRSCICSNYRRMSERTVVH